MLKRLRQHIARSKVDLSCVDPQFLRKTYRETSWDNESIGHFVPVGCRFINCNFKGINFNGGCFGGGKEDTVYLNCNFDQTKIEYVSVGCARFEACSFKNVNINDFFAMSAEFVNCIFSGRIQATVFNGSVQKDLVVALGRSNNQFEGNDFSMATLNDVAFRTGVNLELQKLPTNWNNEA